MATDPLREVLEANDSAMAASVLAHDWASTPLGSIEGWPVALRIGVQLVLSSRFPKCLLWGEQQLVIHNDAFLPILGRKPAALGRSFAQVWAEAWPQIGPLVARAYTGEAIFIEDLELWIERNNAPEQAFFTFCYSPIHDEHGRVVGVIDTVIETSTKIRGERSLRDMAKQLEREVAARKADMDRLWRITTEIIVITSFEGMIEAANPAWSNILGWSRQSLLNRSIFDLLHEDDRPGARQRLEELAQGATIWRFDCRCRCFNGGYRWISWTAIVDSGQIYSVGRDISPEREQVRALQEAEERLRQSQKMEAIGQLTGGLAHDFNNLLAGIGGSLEQMQTRLAQGRIDGLPRYLESAQAAARRASALTHRLLAFARRQTLAPRPVDVGQLVTDMLDLIQRTIGPSIELELVETRGAWLVLVDPNQLENTVLNLCINARDAMPSGGLLTIEATNSFVDAKQARTLELSPGEYLSLRVADNGWGMTPEVAARAFDPFFTTKPIGQGTGLGLSMIYGFAKQSGGHAQIHSQPGLGTTVSLWLPRHLDPLADKALAPADRGTTDNPQCSTTVLPHHILVVDDEPIVRMLIVESLEELGHRVFEAGDGSAGLAVLDAQPLIDLLVSDLGLPGGISGSQLAELARQRRPALKVLFVSGYAGIDGSPPPNIETATQIIGKPFSIDAFRRRVTQLLEAP